MPGTNGKEDDNLTARIERDTVGITNASSIPHEASCYPRYTVQRIRKNDTLYGKTHGSVDGNITACGIPTDHSWCIVNNTFDGKIECKKCNTKIRENLQHKLPIVDV